MGKCGVDSEWEPGLEWASDSELKAIPGDSITEQISSNQSAAAYLTKIRGKINIGCRKKCNLIHKLTVECPVDVNLV